MSSPENPRIGQLKAELEKIGQSVADLDNHIDQIYLKYLSQLEEVYQQKMKELEEWRENEINSAHKFQEGQEYLNDCNFEHKLVEIHDKVSELTKFKAGLLKSQFPEASQYFVEQGYDFSYLGLDNSLAKKEKDFLITEDTQQPLLTDEEAQADIESIRQLDDWRPKGIEQGNRVLIEIQGMPPIVGVVGDFLDKTFELHLDSGKTLLISNLTVNNGLAKLSVV
ncbi:hypothetical protein TVAG_283690 [Trichomonas vaginalis G3]|uniref:Uncharacterized protein n=1 Tax=Trichomonas vaginalis (strain ATCC PRA-98 / G3) TaxID=412133 RepID=A2DES3_TRIV3|nr:hypothetical protein TVAGG3_0576850 [Trichomonas vaginalis G3]EAY21200.1 hypothetical protein TVAG_283690 [Trichomonas vaginalis G3]KAI5522270.1 hypothetical protein TVAGG3_0576850 [Trichomonas vaginalis G3]|eukprot:XP_001582186.1 hypothetical protein [Trichomonas vaginalis G3]